MTITRRNLIDGQWQDFHTTDPNINPSDTTDIVGEYARATPDQVRAAIDAAASAAPAWARTTGLQRSDILDRAATEIAGRAEELGDLLAREEGKTKPEAVAEVNRAAQILRFQAGQALRDGGEHRGSLRPGLEVLTTREPVGVVAVITPWNFPIAIPAWKIGPALAHGNTVVFKPSELAPGCAWEFVDILHRAGLPAGVLNLVMGPGAELGPALTNSPLIDAATFTGSTATGDLVLRAATAHHARVQLEMGGKNPLIVADDANLDLAVEVAVQGGYFSTGQRCTASSRLIVSQAVAEDFTARLTKRMSTLVVADARTPGTDIGPLVSEPQLHKSLSYLDIAVSEGATLVGGEPIQTATPGYFLSPALLLGTTNQQRINREEVFGPVVSMILAGSHDEAVDIANDTEFGLSAGIVTSSLAKATDFRQRSNAGMVMVNVPTAGVDYHVPFGGRRHSSYGPREQGETTRDFYTEVKTSYLFAGPLG